MTRKTITVLIEVADRAGDNAADWAKGLLRESGYLDESTLLGAWWGLSMSGRTWLDAATKAGLIPADLSGEIDRAGDLLMTAWGIIANAQNVPIDQLAESPNWGKERRAWAQAAVAFREEFHRWLADHPGPAAPPALAPCGQRSAAGTVCELEGSVAHTEHEGRFPAVVEVHDPAAGYVQAKRIRLVERWTA